MSEPFGPVQKTKIMQHTCHYVCRKNDIYTYIHIYGSEVYIGNFCYILYVTRYLDFNDHVVVEKIVEGQDCSCDFPIAFFFVNGREVASTTGHGRDFQITILFVIPLFWADISYELNDFLQLPLE